jgi:hypothetical protein
MKCNHPAVCLVLAFLATLVLAGPAAAQHQVPFEGSLEGSVTLTPLSPTSASADLEATGNATHLGRFTVSGTGVVDFEANLGVTSYTFTAADGDTLTAIATGYAVPTGTPDAVYVIETTTITGGTGRFAGATGSFTMVRYFNFDTSETNGTIEGTVSPPGARNR